jgi:hypothetical protein
MENEINLFEDRNLKTCQIIFFDSPVSGTSANKKYHKANGYKLIFRPIPIIPNMINSSPKENMPQLKDWGI